MPPKKGRRRDDKKEEKKEEQEPEKPNGPKTWVVGGWSALTQMAAATAKIEEGDNLLINEGAYDEPLVVAKKTVVTGAGDDGAGPVLRQGMTVQADCTVSNLRFEGSGLVIEKGAPRVTGCSFSGAANLLTIHPYSAPTVADCTFHSEDKSSVYCFPHSKGSLSKCTFTGGDDRSESAPSTCAVTMDNSATAIKNNEIVGTTTGIYAFCAEPVRDPRQLEKPTIQSNVLSECKGTGFHLDRGANCQFQSNTIKGSGYWGLTVSGAATGTFTKNHIHDCVRIREGAKPTLDSMFATCPSLVCLLCIGCKQRGEERKDWSCVSCMRVCMCVTHSNRFLCFRKPSRSSSRR